MLKDEVAVVFAKAWPSAAVYEAEQHLFSNKFNTMWPGPVEMFAIGLQGLLGTPRFEAVEAEHQSVDHSKLRESSPRE